MESLPENIAPIVRTALEEAVVGLRGLYGDRLERVVLFGSQARGEAQAGSDVDVLVVLDGAVDYMTEVSRMMDLMTALLDRYDRVVSLKPVALSLYRNAQHPLMMHVHREGAVLA